MVWLKDVLDEGADDLQLSTGEVSEDETSSLCVRAQVRRRRVQSRPFEVMATNAPRLSSAHSSRWTSPRLCHPRDVVGDAAPVPVQGAGEVGDPHFALGGVSQLDQHLEVGQRQSGLLRELTVQDGGQLRVEAQPGPPHGLLSLETATESRSQGPTYRNR